MGGSCWLSSARLSRITTKRPAQSIIAWRVASRLPEQGCTGEGDGGAGDNGDEPDIRTVDAIFPKDVNARDMDANQDELDYRKSGRRPADRRRPTQPEWCSADEQQAEPTTAVATPVPNSNPCHVTRCVSPPKPPHGSRAQIPHASSEPQSASRPPNKIKVAGSADFARAIIRSPNSGDPNALRVAVSSLHRGVPRALPSSVAEATREQLRRMPVQQHLTRSPAASRLRLHSRHWDIQMRLGPSVDAMTSRRRPQQPRRSLVWRR
jgi:hypothetical protein